VWALERWMPALVGTYHSIVDAVGGGDLEARFLSHWSPPPIATACSLAAWPYDERVLVRNYDYPPTLCDTTALATTWDGTRALAMSDCLWGAVDGINDHGLAVAIAFGGRTVVGQGFGIGLVVRYLLQTAYDVDDAIAILHRVPVSMAYNVALLDRAGGAAVVQVSPDRGPQVLPALTAANRQGVTEWAEHAAMSATVVREAALESLATSPTTTAAGLIRSFLGAPLHRDPARTPWGTVYTAVYRPDLGTLDLLWPDDAWRLSLHDVVAGERHRRIASAVTHEPTMHADWVPAQHARSDELLAHRW
jgi:predicted choloylglycine hydrolase